MPDKSGANGPVAPIPCGVDLVVDDLARAAAFYRLLGLDAPTPEAGAMQMQIDTPGGASVGLFAASLMRAADPEWRAAERGRVSFALRCAGPADVDTLHDRAVAAGHRSLRAPWDAPWGQRYARLRDPDGITVDLFSPLAEADQ